MGQEIPPGLFRARRYLGDMRWWSGAFVLVVLSSCGRVGGTGVPVTGSVEVEPAAQLAVGIGDTVRFRAAVRDALDRPIAGARPKWTTADPSIAVVDEGGLVTARGAGSTTVTASVAGVGGTGTVEVWVPAAVESYEPGTSYFGRRGYVEYLPGELPLVISAPHGGDLEPSEIPDRTYGETVTDSWSRETAVAVRDAFVERTGRAPHLVISHLKRTKLDPNREIVEAAQSSSYAENAWREFHAYVEAAEQAVVERFGSGLYVDLHGHGHEILRAELGYLLSAADLDRPDSVLDSGGYAARSSLRSVAEGGVVPFSEILRGATSLGGELAARGVPAVPSPPDPSPGSAPYFTGGYNVDRHGSRQGGRMVSGIQMELPRRGVRDTDESRRAFAAALAEAVEAYMTIHWGFFAS